MKRGPKRKPAALKMLEGNPGGRPIPEEPEFPDGELARPSWLDDLAAEKWDYYVVALEPVMRLKDRDLLAGYCSQLSRAIETSIEAQTDKSKRKDARLEWEQVRKMGAEFGIGPAEASRVKAAHGIEDDQAKKAARLIG